MSLSPTNFIATRVLRRPTTLSARAAQRLAAGPLDAVTLMRDVCQVARLQVDAAERMAIALLGSHEEFAQLPSGHWAMRVAACTVDGQADVPTLTPVRGLQATVAEAAMADHAFPTACIPSLSQIDFAVVDVETTGTRAGGADRVTEIAIAQVRNGAVAEVYSQLVNPERSIPLHITALTQITWTMVRDQPVFRQIAHEVSSRLAGHVFTAHNAAFDWRFVSEELTRSSGQALAGPRLCTVRLARVFLPQLSRRSLDHVTHYFGIAIGARHRAAGDAVATAEVLLRLLRVAEDQGIGTWTALDRMLRTPASRRSQSASDRRRRAFPLPVSQDDIA